MVSGFFAGKNLHFSTTSITVLQSRQAIWTSFVALTLHPHSGQRYFLVDDFFFPVSDPPSGPVAPPEPPPEGEKSHSPLRERSISFHPISDINCIKSGDG